MASSLNLYNNVQNLAALSDGLLLHLEVTDSKHDWSSFCLYRLRSRSSLLSERKRL